MTSLLYKVCAATAPGFQLNPTPYYQNDIGKGVFLLSKLFINQAFPKMYIWFKVYSV